MANPTSLEQDPQLVLLDEWVAVRRQIAALEGRALDMLAERSVLFEEDAARYPTHRDAIRRSMVAEFSAEGRTARGSVERAFTDASALREVFPAVREALHDGRVSLAHAREVIRAGRIVQDAVQTGEAPEGSVELYEAAALAVAEHESPSRTRTKAREIAAALVPDAVVTRHREAAEDRMVDVRPLGDGLAMLTAVLPEYAAVAIKDRLTQIARGIARARGTATASTGEPGEDAAPPFDEHSAPDDDGSGPDAEDDSFPDEQPGLPPLLLTDAEFEEAFARLCAAEEAPCPADFAEDADVLDELLADLTGTIDDARTMDQIRADVFTDMLLATDPGAVHGDGLAGITARIQVTVAATTLAGLDDKPAELDGHGPLHPDIARELAGRESGWSRLFLHSDGMPDRTDAYTPTAGMRRFLRARDQHCRFPGCRIPAARSEIDHNHDHAKGGETTIGNLAHFCHGHHVLKHPDIPPLARWTARSRADGTLEWTSPHGRAHADPVPRRVMFV